MVQHERVEIVDLAPFFLIVGKVTSPSVPTFSFKGEQHKEILLLWEQLFNHTPTGQEIFPQFLYEMNKASTNKEYYSLVKKEYQTLFNLSNPYKHLLYSFASYINDEHCYHDSLYKIPNSCSAINTAFALQQENSITKAFLSLGNLLSSVAEKESTMYNVKEFWDNYFSSWGVSYLQFLYDHSKIVFWKTVFMSTIIALERVDIEFSKELF